MIQRNETRRSPHHARSPPLGPGALPGQAARTRCTLNQVVARADVDAADRRISPGMVLVAAAALPMLPILHLGNRLSTRRTMAIVARLGRLRFPPDQLRPAPGRARRQRRGGPDPSEEHDLRGTIAADLADPVVVRSAAVDPRRCRGRPRHRDARTRLGGTRRRPRGRRERRRDATSTIRPPTAGPGRLTAQGRSQYRATMSRAYRRASSCVLNRSP